MARIVAIYKNKGATTLPQNYRPIALLQAMYKVFTSLIERRLRELEPRLWKMQMGYRTGRSTDDANHLLLRAIELALRWQGLFLYLFCLDWEKCYDRIHTKRLLASLQRFGLPDHYLRILELIYSKMTFLVSDKWGRSTKKSQAEGLRQGDPLSCFLLVILMTVIMIDTREKYCEECQRRGMAAAQQETEKIFGFDDVEYADDSNFIQMNLPCLRLFANFYILEGRYYGLEANADKSALVVIRPAPVMVARLRHPDGWFFQVKDACKTLGLTYGNRIRHS